MAKKTNPQPDELLDLLNSRLYLARKFSKDYRAEVKKWLKDYNIDSISEFDHKDIGNKIQVPYIFSTVESGLPTIFERIPELIMKQRGKLDKAFTDFANKIWDYLKDILYLEDKIEDVGKYMLLAGMGYIKFGWMVETENVENEEEVPITNADGTPVASQVVKQKTEVPIKNQPFIEVIDYDKIEFSPESRFVMDDVENKIPYIILPYTKTPDEIEFEYGVKIDEEGYLDLTTIDSELTLDDKAICKDDLKRLTIYEYYGVLPKKDAKDPNWKPNRVYYAVFSRTKVLKQPEVFSKKPIGLVDNYGDPTKFWKFGEPKILRELEQDISLGRSRMMDYRDKYGTKIWMPKGIEVDEQALKNPAEFVIMRGVSKDPPMYITPPPLPETLVAVAEQSRRDIQMVSAQLDLSRGGTQSVVNTATGQQIFQQATEKRLDRKRKKIAKFIKYLARNILVLCGQNWDIDELAKITDMNPEEIEQNGFMEKLAQIGAMYDVEIDVESVTNNKETMSAQAIALYRETKDDQMANREEILKEAITIGFGKKDPDRFLNTTVSHEQIIRALAEMVKLGALDEATAEQLTLSLREAMMASGQMPPEAEIGRPMTQNPTEVQKKRTPSANQIQITSQNAAAGKQANVPRGIQGLNE